MATKIDNTATASPTGVPLPATSNKFRHLESFTFTTLGDGHAVPSIFAVTPAASTKVEKLMDTLFGVTTRCNIAIVGNRGPQPRKLIAVQAHILIDTHDEQKEELSRLNALAKERKFGFWAPKCQN